MRPVGRKIFVLFIAHYHEDRIFMESENRIVFKQQERHMIYFAKSVLASGSQPTVQEHLENLNFK